MVSPVEVAYESNYPAYDDGHGITDAVTTEHVTRDSANHKKEKPVVTEFFHTNRHLRDEYTENTYDFCNRQNVAKVSWEFK